MDAATLRIGWHGAIGIWKHYSLKRLLCWSGLAVSNNEKENQIIS